MKTIYQLVLLIAVALGMVSCQDKSYDIAAPVIAPWRHHRSTAASTATIMCGHGPVLPT